MIAISRAWRRSFCCAASDDLLILPVRHAAAGGYLLKLRNGAGDRVVNAPDFFREHGLDDEVAARIRRRSGRLATRRPWSRDGAF